ncbi:unnamed protein product [Phytomonas sp. EM1]|nr:unnamed protein product [Phytomonas sp. EM1]|eukprot:CCW59815.1 unnamed protein product [Phytomonas sp. isolate EM1]
MLRDGDNEKDGKKEEEKFGDGGGEEEEEGGRTNRSAALMLSSKPDTKGGGAQTAWYHFSQKHLEDPLDSPEGGLATVPQETRSEERRMNPDAPLGDHERRMQEFHTSAAEIFKKITSSREEFLAQCTSIVRQTAAMRRSSGKGSIADNDHPREGVVPEDGSAKPAKEIS